MMRWLLPSLVLVAGLCALHVHRRATGPVFADDSAYAALAVARTLMQDGVYGLQPAAGAVPAVRDTLWRLILTGAGWLLGSLRVSALLLGGLCALGTMLLMLRLARLLFPFPPFILYAALLLTAAPGLLPNALSGTSLPLATLLALIAALLHIEGLQDRRAVLPAGAALSVGALAWIRLEFLLLWLLFWLHAVLVVPPTPQGRGRRTWALVRGLTGVWTLALLMLPLVAWNLYTIHVPWPQTPGAPLTLDVWTREAPVDILRRHSALALGVLPRMYEALAGAPLLRNRLARLFVWFGALLIAGLSFSRGPTRNARRASADGPEMGVAGGTERAYSLILLQLLLLPIGLAALHPYLGAGSVAVVIGATAPLYVLAAAFGIFRVPFLAERLYRKWKAGLPAARGFAVWWSAAGGLLLLLALLDLGRVAHSRRTELAVWAAGRQFVSDALLSDPALRGIRAVAADEAGWLAFAHAVPVMDLSGEFTPEMITALGPEGNWDSNALRELLRERQPDVLVLWQPAAPARAAVAPWVETERAPPDAGVPLILQLKWPAAFGRTP